MNNWFSFSSLFLRFGLSTMWESFSQWQELSVNAQYAGVHWTKVVRAPAMPQLGLDHATSSNIGFTNMFYNIVMNKLFCDKQLILVFLFLFSVAVAQNTTGVTTATTMAAAGRNGPLAPHMRPCAPRRCVQWMADNPPSLRMYFLGGLRVLTA